MMGPGDNAGPRRPRMPRRHAGRRSVAVARRRDLRSPADPRVSVSEDDQRPSAGGLSRLLLYRGKYRRFGPRSPSWPAPAPAAAPLPAPALPQGGSDRWRARQRRSGRDEDVRQPSARRCHSTDVLQLRARGFQPTPVAAADRALVDRRQMPIDCPQAPGLPLSDEASAGRSSRLTWRLVPRSLTAPPSARPRVQSISLWDRRGIELLRSGTPRDSRRVGRRSSWRSWLAAYTGSRSRVSATRAAGTRSTYSPGQAFLQKERNW